MVMKSTSTKMVNLNLQYELYTKLISSKVEELRLQIETNKAKKEKLLLIAEKYSVYIYQCYNIPFEKLIDYTKVSTIVPPDFIEEKPLITIYLKNIINLTNKINSDTNIIKRTESKLITFKFYKLVIDKFNDKIVDAIVKENYYFCPSKGFGAIYIVRANQKRKQIDWGKSTKTKNAILEAGNKPYYKKEAEEAKKKGIPYNGIPWIQHRPDLNFFFYWFIFNGIKQYIPIIKDYTFSPARKDTYDSPVRKLQAMKNDLHKASLLYTRKLNYSKDVSRAISE